MLVRLLVVDDSEDDFLLAREALSRAGFRVQALRVEQADELCSALEAHTWDLLLLDWVVPTMTTPEACRMLSRSSQPELPRIVWSGRPDPKVEKISLEVLGAVGFLSKGQTFEQLAPLVRSALANRQAGE